jgi:hypothetical protein
MLMIAVSTPLFTVGTVSAFAPPLSSQTTRKALILSSLNSIIPLGYYGTVMQHELNRAGYQVTMLMDQNVTLDVLLNQLNNYQVVVWRTSVYNYRHVEYWYVGQLGDAATQEQYQSDFAQGLINLNAGILGVSYQFFSNHFNTISLNKVKLFILVSTDSDSIAPILSSAHAQAVVFCNGAISLEFGIIDDFTGALLSNLADGSNVVDSVYNLVNPYAQNTQPRDPLDSYYAPPFWFVGDGSVTIT